MIPQLVHDAFISRGFERGEGAYHALYLIVQLDGQFGQLRQIGQLARLALILLQFLGRAHARRGGRDDLAHELVEWREAYQCIHIIAHEQRQQHPEQYVARLGSDKAQLVLKERVHEQYQHYRESAERHRAQQAHAPVYIEEFLRIVPPARMEQLFHAPRRDVFQRAVHYRARKEQHRRIGEPPQRQQVYYRAHAVYRAVWAVQEAAVYESALLYGAEYRFVNPADAAVQQEPQKYILYVIHALCTTS